MERSLQICSLKPSCELARAVYVSTLRFTKQNGQPTSSVDFLRVFGTTGTLLCLQLVGDNASRNARRRARGKPRTKPRRHASNETDKKPALSIAVMAAMMADNDRIEICDRSTYFPGLFSLPSAHGVMAIDDEYKAITRESRSRLSN